MQCKRLPATAWRKLPEHMSIFTFTPSGSTPLHVAAYLNNLEVCQALVDYAGVPVRLRDGAGLEPLQVTTSPLVGLLLAEQGLPC